MWRKRTPAVPSDVAQAQAIRKQATSELRVLKTQAPMVRRMTDVLIDRQGKNHYIELLYQHVPKGVS